MEGPPELAGDVEKEQTDRSVSSPFNPAVVGADFDEVSPDLEMEESMAARPGAAAAQPRLACPTRALPVPDATRAAVDVACATRRGAAWAGLGAGGRGRAGLARGGLGRPGRMARLNDAAAAENARCNVLLHFRCHTAARKNNASTAGSRTSTGHPIEVTFCTRPPPALSHISVHCPGLQLPPADLFLAPKVIAADDGFFLLRVPLNPRGETSFRHNDYFVYRAHHQDPKLDLLRKPWPDIFGDDDIAILSCGDKQYVVAALKIRPFTEFTFTLYLYRSKPGGEIGGSWTSQLVSVEEPLRDRVCPVPNSAERLMYHLTTKVIILGGANGTVAWVDLWRGILLCNVLEESPKLRDVPLPLPAKGNWRRYLSDCEEFCRDITVSQHKDSFKYVEMEITPPRTVNTRSCSGNPDPVSYLEWVRQSHCPPQPTKSLVPGRWKVTTWSMPIPVTSWDDWRLECTAKSSEFHVDNPMHYELLHKFMSSGCDNKEAKEATLSLGCLHMGYPAFSIDDDVVYLLCKAASTGKMGVVIAFDVRNKELRGVAKLDSGPNIFRRCYHACGISKHLKNTAEMSSKQIFELRHKQNCEEKNHEDSEPYIMVGSLRVVI